MSDYSHIPAFKEAIVQHAVENKCPRYDGRNHAAGSKGVQGVKKPSTKADIIILATETVAMSWARDASSLLLAVVMTGIGRLLYIPPLEWIGAVFFLMSFAASTSALRNRYRKTPQQAADYLRDRYGVFAENAETP